MAIIMPTNAKAWIGSRMSEVIMPTNISGWPRGAAEHVTCIVRDLSTERNPKRKERLRKAIQRMQKRYQHMSQTQGESE